MPPFFLYICDTLSCILYRMHWYAFILSMHLWYTLVHLIQDALICLHSFYAFVIHSRASYTGCTDMPPFYLCICDTLSYILFRMHWFASILSMHLWYTLVHLIQDALICLHSFYAFVIHSRTSYTGCTDMPPFFLCICDTLSCILYRMHWYASILSMHLWYTLVHLIQDALICLHSFYAFVIHSHASYTGCTDMPPFFVCICDTLSCILYRMHWYASILSMHLWYTLVHLIQDALICLHSFYAFVIHSRTSYTGSTDMPPFFLYICDTLSCILYRMHWYAFILSMHLWYTLVHLIQDALICLHSFYAFVIHSRTSYPIENNRGRIGGRWWAAVALRGALPEAHRGGAGEMSALSWEISTAAHRGPPKIYINKDKKGICGPFLLKFMNLFV